MTDIRPLPVYPHKPTGRDLDLLRAAKSRLDTSLKILPVDAVIGSPGRVLALYESPDWICDHALVKNPTIESLKAALEWILYETDDPRGTTVLKVLKETFGDGVKEIA